MRESKPLAVVFSVMAFLGTSALRANEDVSVEASADFFGKYVWRGQNIVDDWVLHPGAGAAYKNLTASFWGNLDLTDENGNNGEFSEIDLTLDYSAQVPGMDYLGYSLGVIHYDFPINVGADDTLEVYYGLALDVPASPSITFYHDVDEAEGTYISFAVGHSFQNVAELEPETPLGLDIGASLGWGSAGYNKFYWGEAGSELNDLVLSAAFPFELAGFTITPSVNYVTLVSDDIRRTNAYGTDSDDMWFAGIGFTKAF
ncbi:MAG: hypothetical protein ABIF19_18320 [Planctomycetota bacterium]